MKDETRYAVGKLQSALNSLKEGISKSIDDLDKDGVIQRFEFTFESLWKTLKIFLEEEGIICKSPKECLKSAFRFGILDDEQCFLDMLDDRNNTTHLYNREESEKIFNRIKENHISHLEETLRRLWLT
jgi:nucleotidyltransferase substrate binding protein (TIGR01987 family)